MKPRLARMGVGLAFLMIVVGVYSIAAVWNKGVYATAVDLLLSYGFADPRGGEYREVEIICGRVSSNKGVLVKTHAWVLPQQANAVPDSDRLAACWNGLVYPVVTAGEPVDLRTDVERMLKNSPLDRHSSSVMSEEELVNYEQPCPLMGCLLFVLGEKELAEKLWQHTKPSFLDSRIQLPVNNQGDPYLSFTYCWAWAHFDHAVCARLRGDDAASLASLKTLLVVRKAVEKDAAQRGFKHAMNSKTYALPYLGFLNSLNPLAEDEARRVAAKPTVRVLDPAAKPITDQTARIAALIRDLEFVDVPEHNQYIGYDLINSPIVKTLSEEGLPAVEPLLECWAHDKRLTRSVSFGRMFRPEREFITVRDAALPALQKILKTQDAFVKEVRDFRNKAKGSKE